MLFTLAGANFRPREARDIVLALKPGDEVVLERDPNNEYDPNAVKVLGIVPIPTGERETADAHIHIGFVERTVAERLAPQLDEAPGEHRAVVRHVHAEGTAKLKPLLETI